MFRQDRTNPSTAVSNWRGRHESSKGWPSTAVSTWLNGGLFGAAPVVASGGTETEYAGFKSHKFTSTGTFTVSDAGATGLVEFIVVASGAGGTGMAAGGGAGGVRVMTAQTVTAQGYAITIGAGGTGDAAGNTSTCAINSISATGGGKGAELYGASASGGSGGAGGRNTTYGGVAGAAGNAGGYSPVEGYAGGNGLNSAAGGGGGGAAAVGTNATASPNACGVGGAGLGNVYFDGSTDYYGGGGGGGADFVATGGEGGVGGGGHGKTYPAPSPTDQTAGAVNTGGGGGGGSGGFYGGSGIVIIRYPV